MATIPITATEVKALRDRTGAGMMDCKAALTEAGGDVEKAIDILRVKGQAGAAKRAGREASEGTVQSYIHANNKIGVLVELDCETDFVARNEDFVGFARDIALHVAAANPLYVSEDDVPAEVREAELRIFEEQAADKPEHVRPRIAEGKLAKWLGDVVLLRQVHVNEDKYEGASIGELLDDQRQKTKENVVIRRFARFAVGE